MNTTHQASIETIDGIMNASREEFDRLSFMVDSLIENCQQESTIEALLLSLHEKDQTIERLEAEAVLDEEVIILQNAEAERAGCNCHSCIISSSEEQDVIAIVNGVEFVPLATQEVE